jgi:hypothetical protein
MSSYLRQLAGRKGKTLWRSSRSRKTCLILELLGERIVLSAGGSLPSFIDPVLPGAGDFVWSPAAVGNGLVPVSSNYDDPFVRPSNVAWMNLADFDSANPTNLSGPHVVIEDEDRLFRRDPDTGQLKGFAENPWPEPTTNRPGNFVFDEPRFPLFNVERGPDGKPLLDANGLHICVKNDLHVGMTTAFEAANWVLHGAENWAGRAIPWGVNGLLLIEPHALIDFNAFYSANLRALFFGVVPYRLPGVQEIKIFETTTSWEMVAHESGHALHNALKPNHVPADQGFDTWGESFADQLTMWSSLQDPGRARALLQVVGGDLYGSNALTRFVEAFAALTGKGTGTRDAFQDLTISTTTDEVHDRSQVLTGAAYKLFYRAYTDLTQQAMSPFDALQQAGNIMGIFLTRATDHTPENTMTLEDVAKAYLKVDKEYFGGKYRDFLANEFRTGESSMTTRWPSSTPTRRHCRS